MLVVSQIQELLKSFQKGRNQYLLVFAGIVNKHDTDSVFIYTVHIKQNIKIMNFFSHNVILELVNLLDKKRGKEEGRERKVEKKRDSVCRPSI